MKNRKGFLIKIIVLCVLLTIIVSAAACTQVVEFKVNFIVDGEIYKTINTAGEEAISLPADPTKNGYIFDGWFWDEDVWSRPFTAESMLTEKLTADMSVYAKWIKEDITKRYYTVTFNSLGGSEVESTSVLEGNTFAEPAQPTREGYEFVGWYKEADLITKWNFETDTVTDDIIIYAGWELVIVEQEVNFVLNYAGAENIVMPTVNGLVTFVPTREGYVFNGWWLSDGQTADGQYILAQKWDTTEIVSESNLVLYAEWVEEATVSSQLQAPSVSINGDVFSWPAITGAVRYDICVTKSGSNEELISESISNTTWTFPNGYDAGYYNVGIRAIGDGMNTVNSVYVSKSYGHHILNSILKIDFDITTSVLTWTAVRNATEYELYINNNLVNKLTYTAYDMSDYEAGIYQVRIVATRRDYQSSTTSKNIEKLRLKTPELRPYIDKENNCYTVMWDSVSYADTYILNINGVEIKVTDATFYSFNNSDSFWNGKDNVALSMTAFDSNADYLVSIATEQLTFNKFYILNLETNIEDAGELSANGEVYMPQSFNVDFDLNGAPGSISSQMVTPEKGISYPNIPRREGYVFRGWFTNKNCTEVYDFTAEISSDITLYAGWQAMNTMGYGNYILDIESNYNSSSSAYTVATEGTSSDNAKYIYFRALTAGTYILYYKNEWQTSNKGTYLYVYNVTDGNVLYSNTKVTTIYYTSLRMSLDAGDIVYIRNYAYNANYSENFSFYITGAEIPTDGGLGTDRHLIKGDSESKNTNSKIFVEQGTEVIIVAETTDDRYYFVGWYNGDDLISEDAEFTYKMGFEDVFFTAKWDYYSLTLEKSIEEAGTIDDYENLPVKAGDSVTIEAKTNNGYMWLGWYEGARLLTTDPTFVFTMARQSVKYTACWIESPITLTQNMSAAGTVSGVSEPMALGQTITITAKTNEGYTWLGWYEGDQLKTKELSFEEELTINKKEYTATWACYTLTTRTNNYSAGTYTGKNEVKTVAGTSVTLTAKTNSGYTWLGWYDGDELVSSELSYTFDMPEKSVTYTATWACYTLTTSSNNTSAGTVTSYTDRKITAGTSVTVTATTKAGYTFVGWYDESVRIATDLIFTFDMPNKSVHYKAVWSKLNVVSNNLDYGTVTTLSECYKAGESIVITASTKAGYVWLGWYNEEELLTDDLVYQFDMPEVDATYTAMWMPCPVRTDSNSSYAGTFTQMNGLYKLGDEVTITSTTNDGYTWLGWYNGDTLVTTAESYTFKLTIEEVTYTAKWSTNIQYIGEDGSVLTFTDADIEYVSNASDRILTGWYLLSGTSSGSYSLEVIGTANIILADECNWTISQLVVPNGNTINIYAQSTDVNMGILTINGNLGGRNNYSGNDGEDAGKIVINGGNITAANIGGGNGVIGSFGTGGSSGNAGSAGNRVDLDNTPSSSWSSILNGSSGKSGGAGTNGKDGGNGGSVESIIINGGTITATNIGGGNGASGGDGGAGGAGGTGGDGYSWPDGSTRYSAGGNGGTGGTGGVGGNGGNGGKGGDARNIIINNGIINVTRIGGGDGGNGGAGGKGGKGGTGGKGGNGALDTSGIIAYKNCRGGNGGDGGKGGAAGNAGSGGNAMITIKGGTINASLFGGNAGLVGSRGSGGSRGYGGKPGYKLGNPSTTGAYGSAGNSGSIGIAGVEGSVGEGIVFFYGTQEDWNDKNIVVKNSVIYFYSKEEPTLNEDQTSYDGNYWHYGNDGVTPEIWKKYE